MFQTLQGLSSSFFLFTTIVINSGMLHTRLHGRACKTLVGLGRLLRSMAAGMGIVSRVQLQQALRAFHISLTPEVSRNSHQYHLIMVWLATRTIVSCGGYYLMMVVTLTTMRWGSASECSRGVYCDQVIAGLLGEMSEDRKFFVRKVCLSACLSSLLIFIALKYNADIHQT